MGVTPKRANSSAEQAEQHAVKANEKADRFRLQIAQSNERAAEAEKQAAQAKLDLEKFKAPRMLTAKQQQDMFVKLKPFSGTTFDLTIGTTMESANFAGAVSNVLMAAGWKIVNGPFGHLPAFEFLGVNVNSTIEEGIKIRVPPTADNRLQSAAVALHDSIPRDFDVDQPMFGPADDKLTSIHLTIGTKPMPR